MTATDPDRDPLVAFARRAFGDHVTGREQAAAMVRNADSTSQSGVRRLLDALDHPDPGVRRTAAETLFAVADAAPDRVPTFAPELYAALDDPATRFAAAGVIQRFDPSVDRVADALDARDADTRRAAAALCERIAPVGRDDGTIEVEESLVDPLRAALSDPDPGVRRAAAAAFRWALQEEYVGEPPTRATPDLLAAADGDDPDVRRHATVAGALLAFSHGADDHASTAVEAVGRAFSDPEPAVREDVAEVLLSREGGHDVVRYFEDDDALVREFVLAVVRATAKSDGVPDRAADVPTYLAAWHAELIEPLAGDLVAAGWDPETPSGAVREAVATLADDSPDTVAPFADRIVDGIHEGVGVEDGATTLGRLAESDHLDAADAVDAATDALAEGSVAGGRALTALAGSHPEATGEAVPALRSALAEGPVADDGDPSVRLAAARAVAALAREGAVEDPAAATRTVLEGLVARPESVREFAGEAATDLAAAGVGPAAVDAVATAGGDVDPVVAVARGNPDRAVEFVRAVANDPGADYRELDAVGEAVSTAPAAGVDAVGDLADALDIHDGSSGAAVARALASVAGEFPGQVAPRADSLARHVPSRTPGVRENVLDALVAVGRHDPDALPARLGSLADVDEAGGVERWAAVAESAPELARRTADVLLARPDRQSADETGVVLAGLQAVEGDEDRVRRTSTERAVRWLTDLLETDWNARGAAAVLGSLAEHCPDEVADATEPLADRALDGSATAGAALVVLSETHAPAVRAAVLARIDDPGKVVEDASFNTRDTLEELVSTAGLRETTRAGGDPEDAGRGIDPELLDRAFEEQ